MADLQQVNAALPAPDKKWLDKIAQYEREFKKWEDRAGNIVKRYRDFDHAQDTRQSQTTTFNILWSNTQVLMPATFARLPKPDVSRRFRDNDPVGRVASLLLERALSYEIDHYPDYRATMRNSVLDRFLGGRGTSWVRYEPHITRVEGEAPPDEGVQITEDADESDDEQQGNEEIQYECAPTDYVHWRDFGHTIARTWEEVTAVWRRVYMNREALVERFGEEGREIPLDIRQKPDGTVMKVNDGSGDATMQACIYEIWDKSASKAVWFNKAMGIIDERDDPLGLANFFPCPRPLYATITTDSLIPVPDYKIYQDQAAQLNKLAQRIDGLITMLQVKGVYDAAIPELARLFKEAGNGDLIPVKSFQAFAEKAGLAGSIDILDLQPIVAALNECTLQVDAVKNEIYELMGVSDIARGASDPQETASAQKLKGSFGNMRLRSKQDEVIAYATELLQIKAQIICKHFQPQTFLQISAAKQLTPEDQQLIPEALELLMGPRAIDPSQDTKEGPLSGFRIEVSSDSMVQMDEAQEKGDRMEFLRAVGEYLGQALPVVQENPEIAPLLVGLLKFGVTGFKVGKTVEGMIDQALDQLTAQSGQPKEEKPDPKVQAEQIKQQGKQQEIQASLQADQARMNTEAQLELSRQESQAKEEEFKAQLEQQKQQQQHQFDLMLNQQQQAFDRWKTELEAAVKIEVANISAKAKVDNAATQTSTREVAAEVR